MAKEFKFAVGDENQIVEVDNWDELEKWMTAERAHWDWLVRGSPTDEQNWSTTVQNHWDNMFNVLNQYRSGATSISAAANFLTPLMPGGQLLTSTIPDGRLVLDIRATAGDVAAANAYAFLKRALQLSQVRSPDALLGLVLATLPDMRKASDIEKRLRAERANYNSSLKSQSARLDFEFRSRVDDFEALMTRGKRVGLGTLRKRREAFDRVAAGWKAKADQSVSEINTVKDTFERFMQLKAPVEYWKNKAANHAVKSNTALRNLAIYFGVFTVVLFLAFYGGAQFMLAHPADGQKPAPVALYVLVSAGLAVFSTVGFWIGRLLTKLYLSEHHLKTDADERAVMTETYLALSETGAASDAEKHIILSALFRSTSDGIVKDDGPPDIGVQALASRYLAQGR